MSQQQGSENLGALMRILPLPTWRVAALAVCASATIVLSFSPHAYVWWLGSQMLGDAQMPEFSVLAQATLALLLGLALRYICTAITSVGSHCMTFDVQYELRRRLAQKLAAVPMGYLENRRRGVLRKTAIDDIEALDDGIAHLIPESVAAIVSPLLLISVMMYMDWRLALVALVPALVGMVLMSYLMQKGAKSAEKYQNGLVEIGGIAHETVAAFPLVKTFGADNIILDRAAQAFRRFRFETGDWIKGALVPATWFQIITNSTPAVVLPVGIWMYGAGAIDISTLLFFLVAAIALGNVFFIMGTLSHRLMDQKTILLRLNALFNAPVLPIAKAPAAPANNAIQFNNVSFRYDDRDVLKDISFTVKPGESVALVGPSGSGKSTITRLLARFWDVSDGEVLIGGTDIKNMTPEVLSDTVALVFQEVFLFSKTVRDNIRLGRPEASDTQVSVAARAARAHDFIMELPQQYNTILGENGTDLSGGQRQRLSIARAVLNDSPILVLDEATAYADPQNELQVQTAISNLSRGKTLLVIAHRLNTITGMDRIIVMDEGEIVDQGRHRDLLERCPLYQKLWADHTGVREFTFGRARETAMSGEGG